MKTALPCLFCQQDMPQHDYSFYYLDPKGEGLSFYCEKCELHLELDHSKEISFIGFNIGEFKVRNWIINLVTKIYKRNGLDIDILIYNSKYIDWDFNNLKSIQDQIAMIDTFS